MEVTPPHGGPEARDGDRRGRERRRAERRARDRRTPPPLWRRWYALVGYGVLGALVAVLLWSAATDEPDALRQEPLAEGTGVDSPRVVVDPPAPPGAVEDAFGADGFERLMVGGEASTGRVVRAELFCSPASSFTIIPGQPVPRSIARLIQDGTVPAAECKWGERSEGLGRPDLLLLVPPERADDLASAPVVDDNYVERRRIVAEIEWIGRSETLALRTAGLLRGRVSP